MREAIISFPMFGDSFQLDPPSYFAIGTFKIYFYGVIIAIGMLLAVWYGIRRCREFGMTPDGVYGYLIWAVIAAVACARLYYCLTYVNAEGAHTYLQNPVSILYIRDGGLAIYGGVIGATGALLVISRVRRESIWKALDLMSFGLLIGQLVGRWGNFFNREAFGYATDVFCRMGLTPTTREGVNTLLAEGFTDAAIGRTVYVHPMFLYESLWNLLGLLLLHFHSKKRRRYQGQYFLLYVVWYGFGRFFLEGLRTDSLWLVPGVIRISQLLAGVTCILAAVFYLLNARRLAAGKKPLAGRLDADDIIDEAEETETDAPAEEADTADGMPPDEAKNEK